MEHYVKSTKRGVGSFDKKKRKGYCKRDPILPLSSPHIQTCNTMMYIFNIQTTIWVLYTIKRLEICIDINIGISEVDHYMLRFTSRIFRLALEIKQND